MSERWLVTGGSGFIGTNVVERILARGHQVLNVDFKPPRLDRHAAFWSNTDVRDREKLFEVVKTYAPDRILHLASDINISLSSLDEFLTTIEGTRNIAEAAKQLPALKRLVHTSTQFVVAPGIEPKDERELRPYTIYGEAKAESEKVIWASELPFPWLIVRPTIIWGPFHPSFATEIFKYIGNRSYLHPKGARPIMRAYGYVENTAEQMVRLAELPANATNRRVFYLGDETIDYDQWADAFAIGLTGRKARRIPVWLLKSLGAIGDTMKRLGLRSPIDSGRAFRMSTSSKIELQATHQCVGAPAIDFDRGVAATLEWLKSLS